MSNSMSPIAILTPCCEYIELFEKLLCKVAHITSGAPCIRIYIRIVLENIDQLCKGFERFLVSWVRARLHCGIEQQCVVQCV